MTTTPDKKRWQRKPEQRPDAILDSALVSFRAVGFAMTRIEDIAKGAHLSKGAIYLYFDSKEQMLRALIERAVLPLANHIEQLSTDAEQADVIPTLQMIVSLASEKMGDPDFAAIPLLIISESGQFPELATYYRTSVLEKVISAFARLIQKGQEEGLFRKDLNPEYAVRTLMGGMFMQMVLYHVFHDSISSADEIKQQLSHHLDLFLRGITRS